MTLLIMQKLDFGGARRITNLAQGAAAGEPITYDQWLAGLERRSWKDNVRVAAPANVTISAPGASIDGVAMAVNDGVLLANQTTGTENGIYLWNGAATPMTRRFDAVAWVDIKSAVVSIDEGTSASVTFKQTLATGTIGTNAPVFTTFGTSTPAATTGSAGSAALATQAEVDAGAVANKIVTPQTLANFAGRVRKVAGNIGDGSATSIAFSHNLATTDIQVQVFELTGLKREVLVEKQVTAANVCTLLFDTAPALNAYRIVVMG